MINKLNKLSTAQIGDMEAQFCSVWFSLIRFSFVWIGMVQFNLVGLGLAVFERFSLGLV